MIFRTLRSQHEGKLLEDLLLKIIPVAVRRTKLQQDKINQVRDDGGSQKCLVVKDGKNILVVLGKFF